VIPENEAVASHYKPRLVPEVASWGCSSKKDISSERWVGNGSDETWAGHTTTPWCGFLGLVSSRSI